MSSVSPGFRIITASRLEPLFARLADTLGADPAEPLEKETILVAQNKGLRAWLTGELAREQGCAASLSLDAPLTFATALARALVPGARAPDGRHPFDAGPLAWRLAPMLDDLGADPVYDPLRAYLDGTGGQAMPLATRLAQLFDDYQVYRPDVLAAWADAADPAPDFSHGAWQAALWRRLQQDAPCLDRAASLSQLADTLRQSGTDDVRAALPRRISVFGALLFPPAYWRVLVHAARHVPVTVYAVTTGAATPAPRHHPFLRALAPRTADFWTVLADLGAGPPEPLAVAMGDAPDALRQFQDALANDALPPAPVPLDPADRSIRVLDCHSPTRELEALRDALLDAFDTTPGLRPADVLVMVPDLDEYAPLVDAVFAESATGDGLRLPYHVVDHPHAPALRVVEAFTRALRLHDGRVTASDLLDLLGAPIVRRAARIDEDELPRLRQWVADSGVRWGLDAERRGRFGVPADDLHTWRFGLDRLLLGVMCDADDLVLGHLPSPAAGLDGADLLGRFAEWAEALFRSLDALDQSRTLADWPAHLLLFLDRAFDARDDEEIEALVHIRQTALDLSALSELADAPDAPVSFRTVRAHLDGALGMMERREPVLTGRITVADPQTLRHAPFRVVALLGLGDGVWPRTETPLGFDLIAHAPRLGDAAPRAFQKQLSVDAVLAARDRLILSYVGRSQKDNSPRARSVVLDAFLDAARAHWGDDADRLVETHRLQPFADDYYQDGPMQSFAGQHHLTPSEAHAAGPFLSESLPEPEPEPVADVSLADLADAWTNPSRHVVRRRLRVALDLDEDAIHDDEPVTLDALGRYSVRSVILEGLLDGRTDDTIFQRLLRSGLLPGGAPGPAWLRQAREAIGPVADAVRQWGPRQPLAVSVAVQGGRVIGTVAHVGEAGALRFRAGSVRPKDLVAAWVDHLALSAGRVAITTTLGTRDSAHFAPVPADDARMLLQALVRGYRTIRQSAPPLFEKASYAYGDKLSAAARSAWLDRILAREYAADGSGDGSHSGVPDANDWALGQARKAFEGGFGRTGDRDDAHVALATRGRDPFADEAKAVHAWAACLWAPLRCYHQTGLPS